MPDQPYDALIRRLEAEVVWEADVGAAMEHAANALRQLQARVHVLETAITEHRAFVYSHADTHQPHDARLWAVLSGFSTRGQRDI
jgi:hypothetical protein